MTTAPENLVQIGDIRQHYIVEELYIILDIDAKERTMKFAYLDDMSFIFVKTFMPCGGDMHDILISRAKTS